MFNFLLKIFRYPFIKKQKLKVVYESDLLNLLKSLGIYQKIFDGKYHCKYCGCLVNFDNLQAVIPSNREIYVICSNIKCVNKLTYD